MTNTQIFDRVAAACKGLLLAMICALSLPAIADPMVIELSDEETHWSATKSFISLSETLPGNTNIRDVLSGQHESAFYSNEEMIPNLKGYDKYIWGHIRLHNPQDKALSLAVVTKFPQLDQIDWFTMSPDGAIAHTPRGHLLPVDRTAMPSRFPMMDVTVEPGETRDVFLRVRSDTIVILPVEVYTTAHMQRAGMNDVLIYGFLIGCMMAMAALGLVSFFGSGRWAFLWFASFCLAAASYTLMGSGIGKAYLWPAQSGDYLFLLFICQGIAMASTAMFVSRFLDAAQHAPRFNMLLQVIAGAALVTCFTTPLPNIIAALAFIISTGLGPLMILGGAIWMWMRGVKSAGLVVLSWLPNQAAITWIYLRGLNLVPYSELNHFTIPVACTLTAVAFTWAMYRQGAEAEHHATHDLLTGLPNRFQLEMTISEPVPTARRSIGVLQIDLDGFKAINDTYGHAAGDYVLQVTAERLREVCMAYGMPFRTGGDEFIVLCNRKTRHGDTEILAQRIIDTVSIPMEWRSKTLKIGASVGVAFPMEGRDSVSQGFEDADAALYKAKRRGKGRVVLCDSFYKSEADKALAAQAA